MWLSPTWPGFDPRWRNIIFAIFWNNWMVDHEKQYRGLKFVSCHLRYSLVVRICGSHPHGPGSIPGGGTIFCYKTVRIFLLLEKICLSHFQNKQTNFKILECFQTIKPIPNFWMTKNDNDYLCLPCVYCVLVKQQHTNCFGRKLRKKLKIIKNFFKNA